MSTITKGTLVMTEYGIRLYLYMDADTDFMVGRKDKFCEQLIGKGGNFCHTAIPLSSEHRTQIEAKIKEMGWVWEDAYASWDKPSNLYKVLENIPNNWGLIVPSTIIDTDFDNAPAQQAEAILVARMLNATKD